MSEFAVILEVVGKAVSCVFNLTVDIICFAFLVASCILPWRIIFIMRTLGERDANFRATCCKSTFLTVLEFISISSALVGCLIPPFLRIPYVLRKLSCILNAICDGERRENDGVEARYGLISTAFLAIFDCGSMFFLLFVLISPFGRQWATLDTIRSRRSDDVSYVTRAFYFHGYNSILDIIFCIPALFVVLIPSLWSGLYAGVLKLQACAPKNTDGVRQQWDTTITVWAEWYMKLRAFCVCIFFHSVIDFACGLFFLVVIISPLRSNPFRQKVSERIESRQIPVTQLEVDSFQFGYDVEIRKMAFEMGLLSLTDIFLLPMLLPLFCTRYRYQAIKEKLPSDSIWGFKEVYLISSQAFLLFLDLFILLPTVPILYVTGIRWKPVESLLLDKQALLDKSSVLYATAMLQLSRLLMDFLLLPFALVVFVSYRRQYLVHSCLVATLSPDEFESHMTVVVNFLTLLHDIILVPPLILLICVLNFIRMPCVYEITVNSWTKRPTEVPIQPEVVASTAAATTDTLIALNEEALTETKFVEEHGRQELWRLLAFTVVDLPFYFLSLFILVTIWRASELWRKLQYIRQKEKRLTLGQFIITSDGEVREAVCSEFGKLVRDIFCLVPFAVITVTFYRLPQVVLELYNKLSSKPLDALPLFDVLDCFCDVPTVGSPTLTLSLKRRTSSSPDSAAAAAAAAAEANAGDERNDDEVIIDAARRVDMHVVGDSFWSSVETTFGGVLASAARSSLPMKLIDTKTIGLTELVNSVALKQLNVENQNLTLWMKIDTGNVKKSTMLKKLRLLPSSKKFNLHVECFMKVPTKEGKMKTEKAVLFKIHPSLKDVENAMELGSSSLPADVCRTEPPAPAVDMYSRDYIVDEGNVVNSFYVIVLKGFVEICHDMLCVCLVILTALNPWRFCRMLFALIEHEEYLQLRICQSCQSTFQHMDMHVLQYRQVLLPAINEAVKRDLSHFFKNHQFHQRFDAFVLNYWHSSINLGDRHLIDAAERTHLKAYAKLAKNTQKLLALFGCVDFAELYEHRCKLHDQIASVWFLRPAMGRILLLDSDNGRERFSLAVELLKEKANAYAAKIDQNTNNLTACLANLKATAEAQIAEKNKKPKKGFAAVKRYLLQFGFFSRKLDASRWLIKLSFLQAMTDIAFVLLFLLLLMTLIRTVPLCRELHSRRSYWPTNYMFRSAVISHTVGLGMDIFYILKFIICTGLLMGTVVGFPKFISEIPFHLTSTKEASDCAAKHLKSFFFYFFCEFLSLFILGRTYRILVKSLLYILFVPAACVAEALPRSCAMNSTGKFVLGLIFWAALLAGSIAVTIASQSSSKTSNFVNCSLMGICAANFVLLAFSIISLSARAHYVKPDEHADKSPRLAWSHILAIITGPVESLQLSAVVLYFFGSVGSNAFGDVPFTGLLLWGSYSNNTNSYYISSSVACLLVTVGGILVTLPLAAGGDDSRKRDKVIAFKESPMFDFVMTVLTRLLTVWIMATLMRSSSCSSNISSSAGSFLSTDSSVSCGGGNKWSATASIALLTFFLITSSVLHADDANLLSPSNAGQSIQKYVTVKFAPLYAITVRASQLLVCGLSLGAFWSSKAIIPLVPILVVCVVVGVSPVLYKSGVCSFSAVTYLRSAGFLSVAWTAIVCISRQTSDGGNVLDFDSSLFIGWGVAYAIGTVCAVYSEWRQHQRAQQVIEESGVVELAEKMQAKCEFAVVDVSFVTALRTSKHHLAQLRRELIAARSLPHLARLVKALEVSIPADRLENRFFSGREAWQERLDAFNESDSFGSPERSRSLVAAAAADPFAQLRIEMNYLLDNLSPPPPVCFVSRHIFTILLTRRMPQDVCWYIFDFFMDTKAMQKILEKFAPLTPNSSEDYYWTNSSPSLRSPRAFTEAGLGRACTFVVKNKENIKNIDLTPVPEVPGLTLMDSRESTFMRESNNVSFVVANDQRGESRADRMRSRLDHADAIWTCSSCTYLNTDSRCEMCAQPRDDETFDRL